MCGIIGFAGDPLPRDLPLDLLSHRGPDSRGQWQGPGCALGQTRLAIIDLDPRADQPMLLEEAGLALVFNGEIYNYKELRRDHLAGAPFRSESDTEVLLRLWERMGPDCLPLLRGMFAFALWDGKERALHLVRDRLGKKPLAYARTPRGLAFASELGALVRLLDEPPALDPAALDLFLGCQFIPAPYSIYKGVEKLLPGHRAVWRAGALTVEPWWRLTFTASETGPREELLERVRAELEEAVRLRLRADVEVGCLLSGGVDSGLVTALAARALDRPLRTFSVGFASPGHDESAQALETARLYGTSHEPITLDPAMVGEWLTRAVDAHGEPFGDKSALPTMLICAQAAQRVKVVLTGDGGDEAFAGYGKYNPGPARLLLGRAAEAAHSLGLGLEGAASLLPAWRPLDRGVDKLVSAVSPLAKVLRWGDFVTRADARGLYAPDFLRAARGARAGHERALLAAHPLPPDPRDKLFDLDFRHYLAHDLLVKADIASMRASLEARSPLLDHKVFELSASIPSRRKVAPGREKALLRELARPLLPPGAVDRPKRGFAIPVADWLRGPFRGRVQAVLEDPGNPLWLYLRPGPAREMFARHLDGGRGLAYKLWVLLVAGLWLDRMRATYRT